MNNKLLLILPIFVLAIFLISVSTYAVADCWQYTTESTCEAENSCRWQSDTWGGWCEELNCWSIWNQTACEDPSYHSLLGKNCTWQGGGTHYMCEDIGCWNFEGTNQTVCENNSAGLNCEWSNYCWGSGSGTMMSECNDIYDESTCKNTTGCNWGSCYTKGCWSYETQEECVIGKDYNGNNCSWDSGNQYCFENGCYNYYNQSACEAAEGVSCYWNSNWQQCEEYWCYYWDRTNQTACENNSFNLSCEWNNGYCNDKGCWNLDSQSACETEGGCSWTAHTDGGHCEEVQCWTWDAWQGGNQTACETYDDLYGLSCAWESGSGDDGWCFQNISGTDCTNMTTERECLDTYYCWWQCNDWNDPSLGGNCNNPDWGTIGEEAMFDDWNPGCYLFDLNQTKCNYVEGCEWNNNVCVVKSGHANEDIINADGINCSMINDSSLCNNIPALSTCCTWQGTVCQSDKWSTACWDQMGEKTEDSCNDATTKSRCDELSTAYYMPCQWNNTTSLCMFKASDVFGDGTNSIAKITNQKNCEAAGGKWVPENYCEYDSTNEQWISVPTGRCEFKCNEEDNCDAYCFGCELKTGSAYSGGKGLEVSATNAQEACEKSKLGYCEFTADTNAPNGIGWCQAKDQFKKGVATDCDSECGACTYLGDPTSNVSKSGSVCLKPECFCTNSKANTAGGGCKWIKDSTMDIGGYCIQKDEKTCEDACDRCYTKANCQNIGRTAVSNTSGSCKWEGTEDDGSCVANLGEDIEVCWDGVDNNDNGLIDCMDNACYSDSFCGFVQGDCFGWSDQTSCESNDCEWVTDNWGSWCDFKGASCWKYDTNESICSAQTNCQWSNGSGGAWCEQDWSIAEVCMGLNMSACEANSNCSWSNDTWCQENPNDPWCQTGPGGWCDHINFQHKDCWQYETSSSECNAVDGCTWRGDEYSMPHCEMNYSASCMQKTTQSTCELSSNCYWSSDYNNCRFLLDQCWDLHTQSDCETFTSGNTIVCNWRIDSNSCEPACFYGENSNEAACNGYSPYCYWVEESGSCEEDFGGTDCANFDNESSCSSADGCRWRGSGWCDPKDGGFSTGAMMGGGMGGGMGGDCYKYDGNQTACEDINVTGISCSWYAEPSPFCDPDWGTDCWQHSNESDCTNGGCWWYNSSEMGGGSIDGETCYCTVLMDQCWSNTSLQENAPTCNANQYCNWSNSAGCQPACFEKETQGDCNTTTGCKWITGWCGSAGMMKMFDEMEGGAPIPIGMDICDGSEINQSSIDICGFGMKDMGDSYGLGATVRDFSNASSCNKEKLSSGGTGSGQDTVKFFVYLDTDGSTTGGCSLSHNSSSTGWEFRLKYVAEWNESLSSLSETFNAYKCDNSDWKATDIKLNTWKKKMCTEINGPMVAIEKKELQRFTSLYDSTADIRVTVATAGTNNNISSPSDTAESGWTTPGANDFEIANMLSSDADAAKFEDLLRRCYVSFEDCYNDIDDDNDGAIDCLDYDCQYADVCDGLGVNAEGYVDTSAPLLVGAKIEEYRGAALIMYDSNKPTNGTLILYGADSTCTASNSNISGAPAVYTFPDKGSIKSNVREYKLWHASEIYEGAFTQYPNGTNDTYPSPLATEVNYYYKLKICDANGKCAQSKCSSFRLPGSSEACSYCNFVTKIKAPNGWDVYYDLNQDGTWEHHQGYVCGPNAGMKTNYSSGRHTDILLQKSDNTTYIKFVNATLTMTGLNDKTRNITTSGSLINGTTDDGVGYVGMLSSTRDKIVNNLHPELCYIKIPGTGTCAELWHCDDSGNNCVNRTDDAVLNETGSDYCIWQIPYCEFSVWGGTNLTTVELADTGDGDTGGTTGGGGTVPTYVQSSWSTLSTGNQYSANIDDSSIRVTQIVFEVTENISSAKIKTDRLSSAPSVGALPSGVTPYQYLELTPTNLSTDKVTNAKIRFKVAKSWVTENEIDKDTVALYRYADGAWNALTTAEVSEAQASLTGMVVVSAPDDCGFLGLGCILKGIAEFFESISGFATADDYYYFESETPGFSYFAIGGGKVASGVCTAGETRCDNNDLQECNAEGSGWVTKETCEHGCLNGACNTEPITDSCTSGTKRCSGNILQTCSGDGTQWLDLSTCTYGCNSETNMCNGPPEAGDYGYYILSVLVVILIILILLALKKKGKI